MEIVIPHSNNSVEHFVDAFVANGFSIDTKNNRQIIFKYLNLIVKVNRIPPSIKINNLEIYTYKLNPNSRYMTFRFVDDCTIYSIDFQAMNKELACAYKAALNRDGLRKAVKFQVTMYEPYLLKLLDDIGLSKGCLTNLNVSTKCVEATIKCVSSRYEIKIPTYSNKEMEKFLYSDFSLLEGNISIFSEGITKFKTSVKIDEFILTTLKTVRSIYDKYTDAYELHTKELIPKRNLMEDKIHVAKTEYSSFQKESYDSYPILSSYREDIQNEYK